MNEVRRKREMRNYRIECKFALGGRQEEAGNAIGREAILGAGNDTSGGLGLLEKEAHLLEKLVLGDVLGALENEGLRGFTKAKLVNVDKSTKGNEAHQGVIREEFDGLGHGRLEEGHLLLDHASVHHEHEYHR
jgi:hypothetical protein